MVSPTRPPLNASFDGDPVGYDELRAAGHMARRRAGLFLEAVDGTPGSVLEIGTGTGTLLRHLAAQRPGRTFTGVDPLGNYVEYAAQRAEVEGLSNVRFATGTAEVLPDVLPDASVGLAMSVDTLHHVADLDAAVSEIGRVTAPGGRWRVMEPNRIHPYVWAYHTFTEGERTFNARDFLRRAVAAGWRPLTSRNVFLYPSGVVTVAPWAQTLERRLERFRPVSGAVMIDLVRDPAQGR